MSRSISRRTSSSRPKIDRGVLGLEGEQPGIGRTPLVPGEAALRVQRELGQLAGELGEAALPVAAQVEMLDVRGDEALAARRDDHREDRLAERPRLRELGEAPLALEPVRREHQDDGVGAVDLLVEGALPVGAGLDAGMLVDVEEDGVDALFPEMFLDVRRVIIVAAGMGNEHPGHGAAKPCRTSLSGQSIACGESASEVFAGKYRAAIVAGGEPLKTMGLGEAESCVSCAWRWAR